MESTERTWSQDFAAVLNSLSVDPAVGLDSAEVIARRARFGSNRLSPAKHIGLLSIASDQFKSIVILLLCVAGTIAFMFSSIVEGLAIFAVIAINATNLTTGAQFTFTQPAFDLLGSDLSSLPVARAVASSSAFPILLSPVSYQNHPASAGFELSRDMRHGLANGYDGPNARRYLWAYNQSIYHTDKAAHPYVHLMDGGLSDNIGVRYIVDNFSRTSGFLSLRKPKIKELVVIIANAKTLPPESLDENESPPNLLDVLYKTTTISMDNYSFESIQVLKDMLHISESAAKLILRCQAIIDQYCSSGHQLTISGHQYKVTVIELNFLNIDDPEKRQRLLSMPTSFKLSRPQVDELINVGGELLDESAAFQELLKRIR